MKTFLLIAILFVSTINSYGQGKKYVSFNAEIANRNGETIYIKDNQKVIKKIEINKEGVFKDTLNIKDGLYLMFDGVEYTSLYLKNGYDLKLKMDAKQFDESIVYSGEGAVENNFLAQNAISDIKYNYDEILSSDEAGFNKLSAEKNKADLAKLESNKMDPYFVTLQKKNIEMSLAGLTQYYKQTQANNKLNNIVSPPFDYVNYKGGKTKLEDFKGKYVYIDVWATWCGPCRAEIPFLKETEKKYHDKNIVFVSMSVDKAKDYEKWKTMVKEKELGGVQVFADNDWNSDFIKAFSINSIPRFILIDPSGKVVKADAARPSSPKLTEVLDPLLN